MGWVVVLGSIGILWLNQMELCGLKDQRKHFMCFIRP